MRYRAQAFKLTISLLLFRVGLCSHGIIILQATWMHGRLQIRSGWRQSRGPESTRSQSEHVREIAFKWVRWTAYLATRGDFESAWSSSNVQSWSGRAIFIGRRNQHQRKGPRSWPDRRAIMATIKRDCDPSKRNHGHDRLGLMAHDQRAIVAITSTDPPDQTAEIFARKSPLKPMYSPLFFLTLDWIVKELSDLKERSWVLHDPPAFRLDCEAIGAELIMNFHSISSNFSLERWTSARKKSSKFASIRMTWSPIFVGIGLVVRFDRLSGGNLSFYKV